MADDRKIVSAIRLPGTTEGGRKIKGRVVTDPDELAKAEGVDLQALYDAGAITGTWKGVKATAAEAEEPLKKKGK